MRRIINEKRAIELFFRSFFVPNNPHHLQTRVTKRVCERLCFFDGINDSKFSLLLEQLHAKNQKDSFQRYVGVRDSSATRWKALIVDELENVGPCRVRTSELVASFPPPLLRLQTVLDRTFSSCLDKGLLRAGLDSPGNRSIVRFIENKVV